MAHVDGKGTRHVLSSYEPSRSWPSWPVALDPTLQIRLSSVRTSMWLFPQATWRTQCFFRCSSTTLRWWLILCTDFERCVFPCFFPIDCLEFFSPSSLRHQGGFELRLITFSPLLYLYFFHVCTILHFFGLPNTVSLRSHYCVWGRVIIKRPPTRSAAAREQCPRKRSRHESERLV